LFRKRGNLFSIKVDDKQYVVEVTDKFKELIKKRYSVEGEITEQHVKLAMLEILANAKIS